MFTLAVRCTGWVVARVRASNLAIDVGMFTIKRARFKRQFDPNLRNVSFSIQAF